MHQSSIFLFFILKAEKGGFKTYVMEIKGNRVYSKLKYEAGVHRVQRVPQTETQGRVHTSTATVAIMPEVGYHFKLYPSDQAWWMYFYGLYCLVN